MMQFFTDMGVMVPSGVDGMNILKFKTYSLDPRSTIRRSGSCRALHNTNSAIIAAVQCYICKYVPLSLGRLL
jgi:hypothetical protein